MVSPRRNWHFKVSGAELGRLDARSDRGGATHRAFYYTGEGFPDAYRSLEQTIARGFIGVRPDAFDQLYNFLGLVWPP